MIKVLYLINHAGKAGTERYVYSLAERLNGKSVKAYFAYNEEGLLVERMKALGVETHRIVMRHPLDLRAAWQLSRLCRKLGIDVIHTQFLRENYISLLSRLFNPRVQVIYTNHFILRNNLVLRILNRILTHFEASIIAVCNKGKEMMVSNGINGKKISVIFNGVDPEFWGSEEKSTMREEFGIGEDEFVLLCGSRFAHDKGHKFLIDAVDMLKRISDRKFRCVLTNDGPLMEEVKGQVERLGLQDDVIFTGFRTDMKNFIYGSDLYINASEHEALSFAIIEVLAAGLPVIATDMGGNSDIINPETDCGVLVKYNDPEGLAKAIKGIMEDRERQQALSRNALKTVRERFNIENMVTETYNLYQKAVGAR